MRLKASFIVPAFNEAANILPFYEEFSRVFDASEFDYELLFIDDGSTDGTRDELKKLAREKPHVLAISFSRNFGKEAAIWAGLNNATGDFVGIIDADLQQQPADALNMLKLLDADDECDIVTAYQSARHENPVIVMFKSLFYKLMDKLMDTTVPSDASDFRVFRRVVADSILNVGEYYRFSKGIFSWVGFQEQLYPYEPSERLHGSSKWSFVKLVKYAVDGIISFSTSPLRLASYVGFTASLLALIYLIVVLVQKMCFGISVPGYATLIGVILLLGGIQLLFLGIAGEYIGRMYIQDKHRPIYIEARRYVSVD